MAEACIGMPMFISNFDLDRAIRQRLAEENQWKITYDGTCCSGSKVKDNVMVVGDDDGAAVIPTGCSCCHPGGVFTENEGTFDESMGDNKPWRYKKIPEKEQI